MPKKPRAAPVAPSVGDLTFDELLARSAADEAAAAAAPPARVAASGKRSRDAPPPARARAPAAKAAARATTADDAARHRSELAALESRDPKFFRFLKSNAAGLLDFGGDGDASGGDDAEEELEDDGEDAAGGGDGAGEEEAEGGGDDDDDDDDDADVDADDDGEDDADGNDDDGDVAEEEDGDAEPESRGAIDDAAEAFGGAPELTAERVRSIFSSAFSRRSLKGLAVAISALRSAVFASQSADFEGGDVRAAAQARKRARTAGGPKDRSGRSVILAEDQARAPRALSFRIPDARVHMAVVTGVLSRVGAALVEHAGEPRRAAGGGAGAGAGGTGGITDCVNWARVAPLARGALTCLVELLCTARDPKLLIFASRAASSLVPLVTPFAPISRRLLRALVSLWSAPPGRDAGVRLVAFLRLRQLATVLPVGGTETVLRAAYLGFSRSARDMSEESAPGVALMVSCLVELVAIDSVAAYKIVFTSLREVAIALRAALLYTASGSGAASRGGDGGDKGGGGKKGGKGGDGKKSARAPLPAAVTALASWGTVNALRALTAIICAYGASPDAPLWELVYPLSQILGGLPRAAPSPAHYPLRLHATAMLCELQWASGVFVPTALPLIDILRSRLLSNKPRGAAPPRPTPLALMIRVSPATADTRAFQDALVGRVCELLLDGARAHFASPALPELVAPIIMQLNSFSSASPVPPWRARAKALVDALTGAAETVAARRALLPCAPGDTEALAGFMAKEAQALRAARAAAAAANLEKQLAEAKASAENPSSVPVPTEKERRRSRRDEDESDDDGSGDGSDASDDSDGGEEHDDEDAGSGDEDNDDDDDEDESAAGPAVPLPVYKRLKAANDGARGKFKIVPKATAGRKDSVKDIADDDDF